MAESLFTVPLSDTHWEEVADRVLSILATVNLAPDAAGWQRPWPGHLRTRTRHL